MHAFEVHALEQLVSRLLGDVDARTVEEAMLVRHGYDIALLLELTAAYQQLPEVDRRFVIEESPSGTVPEKGAVLRIRRIGIRV